MKITQSKAGFVKSRQFTLIELLIVIGLLGALVALILPSLTAVREDAMGDVCDYNQAGTVRVLKQFKQLFRHYPADMHTGLQTGGANAMIGLPDAQLAHMGNPGANPIIPCPSVATLTAEQADSLKAAGISSVCYDTGYNRTDIAADVKVVQAKNGAVAWLDDSDPAVEMAFDGVTLSDWEAATAGKTPSWDQKGGAGIVVVLWITPTTDWESHDDANGASSPNNDWTKGAVKMGLDLQGKCPIPAEDVNGGAPDFAYYMAYFKVYDSGAAARLIGTTCPECGVLNP